MSNMTHVKKANLANGAQQWRMGGVIIVCGLLLVCGFFFAGHQHFSSMDYGMKNSRLRKQVDELESEKRRLLLAREISLSPGEIKKAAKRVGINDKSASEIRNELSSFNSKVNNAPVATQPAKSMVTRTGAVSSAQTVTPVSYSKPEKQISSTRESKRNVQSD